MSAFHAEAGSFVAPTDVHQLIDNHAQQQFNAGVRGADRTNSEFFGADHVQKILAQPGVVGLRVYHARRWENADGSPATAGTGTLAPRAVLVGTDAQGTDVIAAPNAAAQAGHSMMLAMGPICPPDCRRDDIA